MDPLYFEWLCLKVDKPGASEEFSYSKLFKILGGTRFVPQIYNDQNRARDGVDLRDLYFIASGSVFGKDGEIYEDSCSILEMMVALSIRMETIMSNVDLGDRTSQWFWQMIASLELNGSYNANFDEKFVKDVLERFNNRSYKPNGEGGLFTIPNTDEDLRKEEIWTQMLWYIDTLV